MKAAPTNRIHGGRRTVSDTVAQSATPIDLQIGKGARTKLPAAIVLWDSGDWYVEYPDGSEDTIPVTGPWEMVVTPRYIHCDAGETAAGLRYTAVYQ